jgi:ADP-ribose pyrophosphatase YjhB (NUDIX family)
LVQSFHKLAVTEAPPSGHYPILPVSVHKIYKAAGILAYSQVEVNGVIERMILLGKECRGNKIGWSDFGGKIEKVDETIEDTAIREFMEETGSFYNKKDLLPLMDKSPHPKVWNASGKYVLFIVEVPYRVVPCGNNSLALDDKLEMRWFNEKDVSACFSTPGGVLNGDDAGFSGFFKGTLNIQNVLRIISPVERENDMI